MGKAGIVGVSCMGVLGGRKGPVTARGGLGHLVEVAQYTYNAECLLHDQGYSSTARISTFMARKTKAEALATRHLILDAAEGMFLAQGVARTSLQQVATAAGLTRGAIYWHFKDKADLFEAMMDRVILPCESGIADALAAPPHEALSGLADLALVPLRELAGHEQVQRVFSIAMHFTEYTEELAPVRQRHLESVTEFVRQLEGLIRRADETGQLRAGLDAHAAALGLFALVDGLMHHWTLSPGNFDLLRVGEQTVRGYLRGLQADGAAPAVTTSAPVAPAERPRKNPVRPAPSI
jgi:TetR/AcrR family transcriptional regulator, acrAB operon repressor